MTIPRQVDLAVVMRWWKLGYNTAVRHKGLCSLELPANCWRHHHRVHKLVAAIYGREKRDVTSNITHDALSDPFPEWWGYCSGWEVGYKDREAHHRYACAKLLQSLADD